MNLAEALRLGDEELVSFVGAGGKKTAMQRLVGEASHRDVTVGYTTTTHTPPPDGFPHVVVSPNELPGALVDRETPIAFAAKQVENPERADEKIRGYDPSVADSVFESGLFDWLLVKADGARGREFKAPGQNEPVVPKTSTVVSVVASVRAVGSPLDSPTVHRPDRVAAIAGRDIGTTLTPDVMGTVLASHDGGLKNVPDGATVVLLVNKADTPTLRERARDIVSATFERTDRFSHGLVTSFETETLETVES
ncbi:selenium cofactor biosynthesis protein YqeC [Halorussus salinisoli]|uniref:selenium cofactor biosynthesis protein YqeC n=1 Tax=Halorussus salinisoli TaxID=2558242 RepID=UPI0010C16E16|nr:selenium cofactor biosynthesis protein YqeC [Halorussus salinisoli]